MLFRLDVGTIQLRISPQMPVALFAKLRSKLTYTVPNYQFTNKYKDGLWDGRRTVLYKNHTAPAGCAYRIKQLLEKEHHEVEIVFKNDYEPSGDTNIHGFELEDFQMTAVQRSVKWRRGIISAPVRAGKTAIAAAILKRINNFPAVVITYGKDLVNQTRDALAFHLQRPIGLFSESEYIPGDIIVTSYQAMGRIVPKRDRWGKIKEVPKTSKKLEFRNDKIMWFLREAKVALFDECHHALAAVNRNVLEELTSAGYVIGLSGTPNPKDAPQLEVEAGIGSTIFKVRYETLIKHNRIARPMIVIYKLPYAWYTTHGLKSFDDFYEANIVRNAPRNQFISDIVEHMRKKKKTCFIMVRKLSHGPILRSLIPGAVFVHGSIDSKTRKELYNSLMKRDITCIIATVGKEGLNLPNLDVVINAEALDSSVCTIQKMRSLTAHEGKKYGIVIDFYDRGKYLSKQSHGRIKIYSSLGKEAKFITKQIKGSYFDLEGDQCQKG